jgi:GTPase SAR1 family protein
MFVGLFGAGKTSTARRIMGKEIDDVTSTDGIDVYIGKCKVDLSNDQWETLEGDYITFINPF